MRVRGRTVKARGVMEQDEACERCGEAIPAGSEAIAIAIGGGWAFEHMNCAERKANGRKDRRVAAAKRAGRSERGAGCAVLGDRLHERSDARASALSS